MDSMSAVNFADCACSPPAPNSPENGSSRLTEERSQRYSDEHQDLEQQDQ